MILTLPFFITYILTTKQIVCQKKRNGKCFVYNDLSKSTKTATAKMAVQDEGFRWKVLYPVLRSLFPGGRIQE